MIECFITTMGLLLAYRFQIKYFKNDNFKKNVQKT